MNRLLTTARGTAPRDTRLRGGAGRRPATAVRLAPRGVAPHDLPRSRRRDARRSARGLSHRLARSARALTDAAAGGVVLPLAALALLLSLLPGAGLWELDWSLCVRQPWRLLTGHLVHWSGEHLAWDLAVFVGLGWACERWSRRRTAAALVVAFVAISCGAPWLTPDLVVYRGLSGLDAALFTLLAASCLRRPAALPRLAGAAALLALGAKIACELTTGAPLFVTATADVAVVPAAHLWGGLAGLAAGLLPPSTR